MASREARAEAAKVIREIHVRVAMLGLELANEVEGLLQLTANRLHSEFGECSVEDEGRYIEAAKAEYEREGEIEFDDDATVSRSADNGAYVQAWVWVRDKEAE